MREAPGAVAGASLWLKADAGSKATEGTAPGTFWAHQTANSHNATPFSSHGPLLRSTAIDVSVICITPAIPAGPTSVTVGSADITLTADQTGVWNITSGNSYVTLNCSISTKVNVHGISTGSATITFTPDCGGAAQAVTKDIDVSVICIAPAIPAGPSSVTVGGLDISLTVDQNGVWSIISRNSFATLNNATAATVKVHGLAPGTSTFTFPPIAVV